MGRLPVIGVNPYNTLQVQWVVGQLLSTLNQRDVLVGSPPEAVGACLKYRPIVTRTDKDALDRHENHD